MRALGLIAAWMVMGAAVPAHASLIAFEDFEGTVTGWSNNSVSDPGGNGGGFTKHLGRYGQGDSVFKTFALSGSQTAVNIKFDLYRLDSWDNELFIAIANDRRRNSVTFVHAGNFNDGGPTNIYNPTWTDRIYSASFLLNTSASSFTLTFSSGLDQDFTDESWGVDNLRITDNISGNPGAIPEPATWAMMILGFGAAGSMIRRRKAVVA